MSITVILDNYQNFCYPGQTISGRVECNFDDEEKLRAIRIRFHGAASTKWRESRGSGKNKRTVYFSAEQEYFSAEYNLLEGGDDFTLRAGKYTYAFSYILPPQLPSTCDLEYGRIRYRIIATVDRPWRFDYETELFLNVVSLLDLNYIPGLAEERATAADKEVGCWCFKSGPVNLNVSLPASGFVPGQEVNVGCYVQNLSNSSVTEVKYTIDVNFEYIAHIPYTKSRFSSNRIQEHVEGGIGAHGEKSWTAKFTVPPKPYLNLVNCAILKVFYILKVTAVLPFPHLNLDIELPIMIGNVPLLGINHGLPGPPVIEQSTYPPGYQMTSLSNPAAASAIMPTAPIPDEGTQPKTDLPSYNEATTEKA